MPGPALLPSAAAGVPLQRGQAALSTAAAGLRSELGTRPREAAQDEIAVSPEIINIFHFLKWSKVCRRAVKFLCDVIQVV